MIENDEADGEFNEDAKNYLDFIEKRLEQFLRLEAEIEGKIPDVEKENVSKAVKAASEVRKEPTVDDFVSSVSTVVVFLQCCHMMALFLWI